jgi:methionyl-tRNA formyltransferase
MKVILFGFTGLGNAVMQGLMKTDFAKLTSVFTKKYSNPYPYYDEIQMEDFCREHNIKCHPDVKVNSDKGINLLEHSAPDLIIVSSFNQIISKHVMEIPKLGIINVHPSLLPKYRGPFPDKAVLLNDEKETGVTIHYLTEEIDRGNIITQQRLEILPEDNCRILRKKLALLSEEMVAETVKLFKNNKKPEGVRQNETEATFFPKPKTEDGYLENETGIDKIRNKVRALNPFPGTSVLTNNKRAAVDRYKLLGVTKDKNGITEEENYFDIYRDSLGIRLFKKK